MLELVRGADREVFATGGGAPSDFRDTLLRAVRGGVCGPQVKVRFLGGRAEDRDWVREALRHRVRVRVAEASSHGSLLVDRSVAVVPSGRADGLLVVVEPSLVTALVESFLSRWSVATSWVGVHGVPDEFERSVLLCLVSGMTDDVAAGRLGVSARTVRRHVNGMMDRVGARSRFELGFRAAEFGWLEPGIPPDGGTAARGGRVPAG
ncbi:LuxR C-terminal-related transcriptional regulator [Actinosynnema sp. NPDC020468]|uniref:helix-turn-helix transcriptional regulator n=1 Tax=Actinosynnema sp. NPDC020468 TaxID=3154488 RepID=UPI0033DBDADC